MTAYDLDHLEEGTLVLPSGAWKWRVIRVLSLPEREVAFQHLFFFHEEHGGGVMRARIAPHITQLDAKAVEDLARNPEERSLTVEGREFVVPPGAE